jgi:hypothetical protein
MLIQERRGRALASKQVNLYLVWLIEIDLSILEGWLLMM